MLAMFQPRLSCFFFTVQKRFKIVFSFPEPPSTTNGELPVTIDHQHDTNTSSNLTRNDANCDKTGTCYDGKKLHYT